MIPTINPKIIKIDLLSEFTNGNKTHTFIYMHPNLIICLKFGLF